MTSRAPQEPTAGSGLRWSRAALLATVAMGSGVVAHQMAGGLMPGRGPLAVLFVVCLLTAGALLGRPASVARVVLLVAAGQTFVHGALTAMSGHRGDPPLTHAALHHPAAMQVPTGDGRRVGSLYEQMYAQQPGAARAPLTVPAPVQHLLADLTGPHAVMALAHLGAAVVVGLWLARGERALWAVLAIAADGCRDLVGLRVARCLATLAAVSDLLVGLVGRRPASAADALVLHPPVVRLLARCVVRRGPPARLAA